MPIRLAGPKNSFRVLVLSLVVAVGCAVVAQASTDDAVAIYSTTYNRYHRVRQADHSYKPETFTFAQGGYWSGAFTDTSIDGMPFMKIVHTIAVPLRKQGYVAAVDPNKTDLIVFVYWGTTRGAADQDHSDAMGAFQNAMQALRAGPGSGAAPMSAQSALNSSLSGEADMAASMLQMANADRDKQNMQNARILGYGDALQFSWELSWLSTSQSYLDDLEHNRFFVILRAYDFQLLWKHKKWKPLWETIYSIPQQGNRFDVELADMTAKAAPYFGSAKGLVRDNLPEGRVEVGTPVVVPAPQKK